MTRRTGRATWLAPLLVLAAAVTAAPGQEDLPGVLKDIGIDQKLGAQVPLDLVFRDETGREVTLADYVHDRPVILSLNYYECPMLCTMALNGLVSSIRTLAFDAGKEYSVLTVSIDPTETPELAAAKKATYIREYGRPGAEEGWHFLTGPQESIARLADAVGFRYIYDEESGQYAHAAGIVLLTADGRVARYFYGIDYPPRDLRLGLVETSEGTIGAVSDQILLFCYHYDPATGKYGAAAVNFMRAGGVLTILVLAILILLMLRRDAVRARARGDVPRPDPRAMHAPGAK